MFSSVAGFKNFNRTSISSIKKNGKNSQSGFNHLRAKNQLTFQSSIQTSFFLNYTTKKASKHEISLKEYWDNTTNQRFYLDKLYKKLNFKSFEDWYNLPSIELIKHGGGPILARNSSSIPQTLQALYPSNHFDTVYSAKPFFHNSFWTSNENLRHYFDYLSVDVLQLPDLESWFFLSPIELNNVIGGKILLQRCNDNVYRYLQLAYPEADWDLYRSTITQMLKNNQNPLSDSNSVAAEYDLISPTEYAFTDNFWESVAYQRKFLDELKPALIKWVTDHRLTPIFQTAENDDSWIWYHLNNEFLRNNGGNGLLLHYNNNLSELFPKAYPEIDWNIYHLMLPKHFWRSEDNCRQFITYLFTKLDLNMEELTTEYQKISTAEIRRFGGVGLLSVYGRLYNALRFLYPDLEWPETNSSGEVKDETEYREESTEEVEETTSLEASEENVSEENASGENKVEAQ